MGTLKPNTDFFSDYPNFLVFYVVIQFVNGCLGSLKKVSIFKPELLPGIVSTFFHISLYRSILRSQFFRLTAKHLDLQGIIYNEPS